MSVRAVFEFDPAEHYQVLREVTRLTPARYVRWGMAVLALGLLAWNVLPGWGEYPFSNLFWNALPYLALLGFWLAFIPLLQRRAARKLPTRDASLVGPQERVVNGDGYHSRGNGVALDVPWHVMTRAVETEQFFLFFPDKQCAYYLPKRVLNAEQVADLRRLIRAALPERSRLAL